MILRTALSEGPTAAEKSQTKAGTGGRMSNAMERKTNKVDERCTTVKIRKTGLNQRKRIPTSNQPDTSKYPKKDQDTTTTFKAIQEKEASS